MRYIPCGDVRGPSLGYAGTVRPAIPGNTYREPENVSFAPEVVADSGGKFHGNQLRFATREEAEKNVRNLAARWFLVTEYRVVPSSDPVNVRWDDTAGVVFL